ncbi:hypothetical protein GpartN1_g7181.t1 [Galdieria partita]|uniref:Sphingomyelin synthase-like domain-containing protein n=1 Tax=Galdieria partita TaxID=83374 RepID=A0A9C7Q3X4_9RHOD|nr:hypothetical protein GpartN1_g7181.t1 [Galdieria partita]
MRFPVSRNGKLSSLSEVATSETGFTSSYCGENSLGENVETSRRTSVHLESLRRPSFRRRGFNLFWMLFRLWNVRMLLSYMACGFRWFSNKSWLRGFSPKGGMLKHWKEEFLVELVLLRRNFLWILVLFFSIVFHNSCSNLAYYLYNQAEAYKLAPLHDWFYEFLPKFSKLSIAERICNVSFYIINLTMIAVAFQPFFRLDYVYSRLSQDMLRAYCFSPVTEWEDNNTESTREASSLDSFWYNGGVRITSIHMIRRFSAAYFVGCLLRCTSFLITTLPGTAAHCLQEPLGYYDPNKAPGSWKDILWNTNWETKCGDLLFSGHSQQGILATLIIHRYCSLRILAYLMWPILLIFEYTIIVTRRHYSVDVLVAMYVIPLVWYWLSQSSLLDEANDQWVVEKVLNKISLYRYVRDEPEADGVV